MVPGEYSDVERITILVGELCFIVGLLIITGFGIITGLSLLLR